MKSRAIATITGCSETETRIATTAAKSAAKNAAMTGEMIVERSAGRNLSGGTTTRMATGLIFIVTVEMAIGPPQFGTRGKAEARPLGTALTRLLTGKEPVLLASHWSGVLVFWKLDRSCFLSFYPHEDP